MTKDKHEATILKPKKGKILEENRTIYFKSGQIISINDVQEVRIGKTSLRILDGNGTYFIVYPENIDYMVLKGAQVIL